MRKSLMFLGILYPLICSGDWWITTVDSHSVGGSSIAIDSSGIPHIAYTRCDAGGFFKYVSGNPIDSSWTLEFTHDSSSFPNLKLDSKGLPHIISENGWYIWKDTNDIWSKEKVRYEIGSGWYYHGHSLVLDTNDYPHILGVYRNFDLPPDYAFLFHWYKDSIGWHTDTVDTVSNGIDNISIVIDNENVIHIAYPSLPGNYLCYAKKIDGVWDKEVVELYPAGYRPWIALDAYGRPCITWKTNGGGLKFARKNDKGWEIEMIDTAGYYVHNPVLCIGKDNNPRIAYLFARTHSNGDLKYAWFDGASWNTTTIDTNVFSPTKSKPKIHYTFMGMEIDKDGISHICYDYQKGAFEKYAKGHGPHIGVEESEEFRVKSLELKVYPNPFTTGVRVKGLGVSEGQKVNLKIYDMMGRLVEETNVGLEDCKIGESLPAGIYFVKVQEFKSSKVQRFKVVKIIKMGRVR